MGLDQYLSAKISLGKYCNKDLVKTGEKVRKLLPDIFKSGNIDSLSVKFEVGYWRKANQIHKWFVDNCQEGTDDCRAGYVSREDLEKLKALCGKVLKILSKKKPVKTKFKDQFGQDHDEPLYQGTEEIEKLLPTQSGFFFGSYTYDEYYKLDIEETIKIIDRALKLPEEWSFEYQSSW